MKLLHLFFSSMAKINQDAEKIDFVYLIEKGNNTAKLKSTRMQLKNVGIKEASVWMQVQ